MFLSVFPFLFTDDIIVVDQGFRDALNSFAENGYAVKAPIHKPAGLQLTTKEANETRLVTKIRYEVERANGMLKNIWKMFEQRWESLSLPNLMTDFSICAALYNRFYVNFEEDVEKSTALATKILTRVSLPNNLARIISSRSFDCAVKKRQYSTLNDFSLFPKLEMEDLMSIAFGTYQIFQAKLYTIQHLEQNGDFEVFLYDDKTMKKCFEKFPKSRLITINLKSRFVAKKCWNPYVLFNPFECGAPSILGYCCNCKVGNRTVGVCSHVMSLLFYLGFAHRQKKVLQKAVHLKYIFEANI